MSTQMKRSIKSPYGPLLSTSCWLNEAVLRMLVNSLNPEVLSQASIIDPSHYDSFIKNDLNKIVESIKGLQEDETLVINNNDSLTVYKTHPDVPRVLFSENLNKNTSDILNLLYSLSIGSWVNLGDQAIVSLFYEIFSHIRNTRFTNYSKLWLLTSSLGKIGRLQVLAAQLAGFSCLVLESNRENIKESLERKYTHHHVTHFEHALVLLRENSTPLGVSLASQPNDTLAKLMKAKFLPNIIVDNTNYIDHLLGQKRKTSRIPEKIKNLLYFRKLHSILKKKKIGLALTFIELLQDYTKILADNDRCPLRWIALSGNPQDVFQIEEKLTELFPDNTDLLYWFEKSKNYFSHKGLPSGIFWLNKKDCVRVALNLNEMVTKGLIKAPLVFASENIALCNQSSTDQIALAALINCARGASWVSLNQNPSITGFAIVADGTAIAAKRLQHAFLPAKSQH